MGEEIKKNIIVTGARSQIGHYLLPMLINAGYGARAITRVGNSESLFKSPSLEWTRLDISKNGFDALGDFPATCYIHIAPLPLLPPIIESLEQRGVTRVIAFGSTSRYSKTDSASSIERAFAKALIDAEETIAMKCKQLGIDSTIFRPTLIYGCGSDKNVTTIANTIKKFGVFPVVGAGAGRRQPVHAQDLAIACMQAINAPKTFGKAYNLSGGETLTYGEMVDRIFDGLGRKRRKIRIPLPLYKMALRAISLLPKYNYVTEAMAERMNVDLCFDHWAAANDFGFDPRGFVFDDPTNK